MTAAGSRDTDALLRRRTRSAVLNVLVAVGTGIAIGGGLLRWRDRWALGRAPEAVRRSLAVTLIGLAVASYVIRRTSAGRGPSRFYRGHVLAAAVAALGVPLGLAYGWFVRPRLDAVGPFWVAALALGFLALPRAHESPAPDGPLPTPEPAGSEPHP